MLALAYQVECWAVDWGPYQKEPLSQPHVLTNIRPGTSYTITCRYTPQSHSLTNPSYFAAMKKANCSLPLLLLCCSLIMAQDVYNAIRNTLAHYPLAIDGKQFSDLSLVFTPDAVANVSISSSPDHSRLN